MDNNVTETVQNDSAPKLKNVKRMTLKRSIICSIAFIVITIILFSAQSVAYFTSSSQSDYNNIMTAKFNVTLNNNSENEFGEQVATSEYLAVMPATTYSKIVTVQNSGELSAYVRIKLDKVIDKDEADLPANWKDLIICDLKLDNPSTTDVIEGPWTYKDGYYYYNVPLKSGETTKPLFKVVTFSPAMGNQFKNTKITFTITAEAVQSDYNGDSVFDAAWK